MLPSISVQASSFGLDRRPLLQVKERRDLGPVQSNDEPASRSPRIVSTPGTVAAETALAIASLSSGGQFGRYSD